MTQNTLNKSQQSAVDYIDRWLHEHDIESNAQYGADFTTKELEFTDYGATFYRVEIELLGLPEGNLLKALYHTHYLFAIGRRGKIEMLMGVDSMKQFNGRMAFGMHINF